jgi:uncharacterized protein YjbI with pentapeptide repeats
MKGRVRFLALLGSFASAAPLVSVRAQDMLQGVDLRQPAYSQAEMTRADVEKIIAAGKPVDFSGRSLNGLDLSGLDFSGANFRAARLNQAKLTGAKLDSAILDQAWLIEADLSRASLKGVRAFAAQMQRLRGDGADFSGARVAGDLTGASLRAAIFDGANLSADMKNQSMGLMRAVMRSTQLQGARFVGAGMMSVDMRFAHAAGADFSDADLTNVDAAGADFTGATFRGAKVSGLDLDAARIDGGAETLLKGAQNIDRALRQ